jgi:hypothetical protein
MNPYLVPGLEARPEGPLCPFHTPEHERYYVPVDNTQEAFEKFQGQMSDLRGLRDEGRLVVVSGLRGCGKTALINRCASWLRDSLHGLGAEAMIFSLTHEYLDNQSIQRRMDHVFQCVVNDLLQRRRLSEEDHIRGLKEQRDDLGIAYRYLSGVLDDLLTIVLLPPSEDLVKEVAEYAKYAHRNIVFFVESSYVDDVESFWSNICSASRVPPVRLEVGLLGERDGWRFAQARQEHHSDAEELRKVSESTMRRVMENWNTASIGQLQALLFGVYRELSDRPEPEDVVTSDEVTYGDITNYYFKLTRNSAGRLP